MTARRSTARTRTACRRAPGPARLLVDAPVANGWLLDRAGNRFQLLTIDAEAPATLDVDGIAVETLAISVKDDPSGALVERYLGTARSAVYLVRPDQHVAARWTGFDADAVRAAVMKATGRS